MAWVSPKTGPARGHMEHLICSVISFGYMVLQMGCIGFGLLGDEMEGGGGRWQVAGGRYGGGSRKGLDVSGKEVGTLGWRHLDFGSSSKVCLDVTLSML